MRDSSDFEPPIAPDPARAATYKPPLTAQQPKPAATSGLRSMVIAIVAILFLVGLIVAAFAHFA